MPTTNATGSTNPTWVDTTIATFPITNATHGQRFTTGSRVSAGHDDDAVEAGLRINTLFITRPELVLGEIAMLRMHGQLWQSVSAPIMDVATLLGERLAAELPINLFQPNAPVVSKTPVVASTSPGRTPRQHALMKVYETAKALLKADVAGEAADDLRDELNQHYAALVAQFGCIHARANQQALKGQPELYFLRALETNVRTDDGTVTAQKSAIFFQPTLRPTPTIAIGQMTPAEALLRCLNDVGRIDLPTIAIYSGLTEAAVIDALRGRIFCDPETEAWQTADAYLTGNVRQKLAVTEQAAISTPTYEPNVIALQAVQPTPLTAGQIRAKLGAPWIPEDVIVEFICTLLPRFRGYNAWTKGTVRYHAPLARWEVKDNSATAHSPEATSEWGIPRRTAIEILEDALNGRVPVVYDLFEDAHGHEKRVPNREQSLLAQEKWRRIAERFSTWVWEDVERAERLCAIYNQCFNSMRRRDFDGQHLLLPGLNRTILRGGDLLPHQKDAVWCALQQQTTLLDLPVGAGKTFIGLVWAYEIKRLGIAKKVLITVPPHLVEQWGAEANRLYPTMRVLVMSPEDFSKERRGEFLSQIATEEFDAIICSHTSFALIEPGPVAQQFIQREVAKLRQYLVTLRAQGEREHKKSLKEIEQKVAALESKLKETEHRVRHDSARIITWSELGIDALFVDEAHEHKNLAVPTIMGNIPGVPKGDSKRAFDMRIKTWDLIRRSGKVVFATGTPILNSVGEAFVMKTYLAEALLEQSGIALFDAWARTFAEVVPIFEMTPDGGGFRINIRLARFVNLPELFSIWYQFTFSRSRAQLNLPTPELMSNKRIGVSIPASPRLKRYVQQCVARVEAIKSGQVDPRDDNMLTVVSDGRKAALDTRMVLGGAPDPVNKIGVLADYVAAIYQRYDEVQAAQIIYCELGTPKR